MLRKIEIYFSLEQKCFLISELHTKKKNHNIFDHVIECNLSGIARVRQRALNSAIKKNLLQLFTHVMICF